MATPSSDHHRPPVMAWRDQPQSSVRSGPAKNPFQLDTYTGDSEEFDDERRQKRRQQHAQPHRASSGSDDWPLSTLADDIDPGPDADDVLPIGLLAKLAISTPDDDPAFSEEQDGWKNADADDVVRSHLCFLLRMLHWKRRIRLTRRFPPLLTGSCH
jgi:hypothetical protein